MYLFFLQILFLRSLSTVCNNFCPIPFLLMDKLITMSFFRNFILLLDIRQADKQADRVYSHRENKRQKKKDIYSRNKKQRRREQAAVCLDHLRLESSSSTGSDTEIFAIAMGGGGE